MLRNSQRHPVDSPVFRRGVGAYINPYVIYGQRGGHKNDEESGIPPSDTPHRAQTPLHSGTGGSEVSYNQRDPMEGESCRPFDEIITNDGSEEMDEGDFQRLIKEWLAE